MSFSRKGSPERIEKVFEWNDKKAKKIMCEKCGIEIAMEFDGLIKQGSMISIRKISSLKCPKCGAEIL